MVVKLTLLVILCAYLYYCKILKIVTKYQSLPLEDIEDVQRYYISQGKCDKYIILCLMVYFSGYDSVNTLEQISSIIYITMIST